MSRCLSVITLLLLLLLGPASAAVASENTILVVGDSLSADYGFERQQGWVSLLAKRLSEEDSPWSVTNASISGDTTRSGRARLPKALQAHEPEIVIIQLGGNDGLRGLPIAEAQGNLSAMIQSAQEAGAAVVLVGVRLPSNYGRAYLEAFANMYQELADDHDIRLVPQILSGVAERSDLMQADGIHPTAEAQPIILDNIWPQLRPLL